MALSDDLTHSGLKAPPKKKLVYGERYLLPKVKKETWREYLFSNSLASIAMSTALVAAFALFATAGAASGVSIAALPYVTAALITPIVLTAVAPAVNHLISGTGTERDPKVYVERQKEAGKLKNVEPISDEVSPTFFRRPSLQTMAIGAVAGLAIGALSFSLPFTAPVAGMFAFSALGAALAGAASATIPSTLERLNFENKIREIEVKEANTPAPKPKAVDLVEEAAAKLIISESKQQEFATKALENGTANESNLSSNAIKAILERGPKADFATKILEEKAAAKNAEASKA